MFVYYAFPVDAVNLDLNRDHHWRVYVQSVPLALLQKIMNDPIFYIPQRAFVAGRTPHPALQEVNEEALARADLVVAFLPWGVVSYGVPIEVSQARMMGKKVLLFIGDEEHRNPSWVFPHGDHDNGNTRVRTFTFAEVEAVLQHERTKTWLNG